MTETTSLLTPYQLLEMDYSVVPSGAGDTEKQPLVPWAEFQSYLPNTSDIEKWECQYHPHLWGIVTGSISGVVVIDVDVPELRELFDRKGLEPHIQTPRGGFHYWFQYPGHSVKTTTGVIPGIDIRGDGGFVNVTGIRKDGEYHILKLPSPDSAYPWELMPSEIHGAILNNQHHDLKYTSDQTGLIPEGERNNTLTSFGGSLRLKGLSLEAIDSALQAINRESCSPPLPEKEVSTIATSVTRYPIGNNSRISPEIYDLASERIKSVTKNVSGECENKSMVSRAMVEEWIKETRTWFSYEELDRELGITSPQDKTNRRNIIKRLKDEGIIEGHPRENKKYRYKNVAVRKIDYKKANSRQPLNLKYPFLIEKYFNAYPGNIIVLAGAADAGKTAFLLNFIRMNMYEYSIFYQSSEMGEAELANRLENFDDIQIDDWNFEAEERSSDFADVIRPDCINIIDYLEISQDFYNVAGYLRQIHDRLSSGIAIVALQKKRGANLGRGGDFGLEKPRLYLSMDKGKITIQKCKNWRDKQFNPNYMKLDFKTVAGCKFMVTRDWYKDEAE